MSFIKYDKIILLLCPLVEWADASGKAQQVFDSLQITCLERLTSFLGSSESAITHHWAILVRHHCYDVSGFNSHTDSKKRVYLHRHVSEWKRIRDERGLPYWEVPIGLTFCSTQRIEDQAYDIWRSRFNVDYKLRKTNCQNFAYLLFESIRASDLQLQQLTDRERQHFQAVPMRATQVVETVKVLAAVAIPLGEGFIVEVARGILWGSTLAEWVAREGGDRSWLRARLFRDLREDPAAQSRYVGYHADVIGQFSELGFPAEYVVLVLDRLEVPTRNGASFTVDNPEDQEKIIRALQGAQDVYCPELRFDQTLPD